MEAKELISELAERIERTANVRAVFGEPVREGDNTIIPVARVVVRGGGGGGSELPAADGESADGRKRPGGNGIGLGLNIVSAPVGYVRLAPEGPTFVPVVDKTRVLLGGLAVAGFFLWSVRAGMKLGHIKKLRRLMR